MKTWQNLAACYVIAALLMSAAAAGARDSAQKNFRMTVVPADGNTADVKLVLSFATPDRAEPREARVLINSTIDGRNACYVYYNHEQKVFNLVKNPGLESFMLPVRASGKLTNAQCQLDVKESSAEFRDGVLKVELALHFKSSFSGERNVYLWMRTANGEETGFQASGKWMVPHGLLLRGTAN
jgi:hypothetical protein